MDNHRSPKTLKRELATQNAPISNYDRRASELTDLLTACRELSNILNLEELYEALSVTIQKKFEVSTLALFFYDRRGETFNLAYSHGLGKKYFSFNKDKRGVWQAILQGEPFDVVDEKGKRRFPTFFKKNRLEKLQSVLWIPLIMRTDLIGVLTVGQRANTKPFTDFDRYFLQQISAQTAVCINTCRLYAKRQREKEDLDKTLQNLSLLYSIGKAMNYISDLKSLLQYILSQAIEITSAEKGSIMLYDLETDQLNVRVLEGLEDKDFQEKVNNNEIKCRSFKPGEGIAGRVFLMAKPMVVNNIREDDYFIQSDTSYVRSIACIPMVVYSEVIGVINVTNKRGGKHFVDEDLEMLKAVADQAAVAINKAQLWDMAVTDSLTGLYVRRYFMVKLQEEIHRAERYNKILSIVMADLDRFKRVNDIYGHDAGDRVLQSVGKFLMKNIRDVDIIGRYGGEEFVLLIPDADKDAAYSMSERLREMLAQIKLENVPQVTISLGIATYPNDGTDLEDLIRKADAAMYAAKLEGGNKVRKYSSGIKLVRQEADEAH